MKKREKASDSKHSSLGVAFVQDEMRASSVADSNLSLAVLIPNFIY